MPDPTAEPTQTPDLPEDPPPTQQPETELFPETAADNGQLAVLKAQLENLLADETRLKAEIDTTADPSDQLASLRSQRRSTERSISNVNDQIDAMEDSAQIAEDIQKKQSQIDNLQAQINALSAKEEKIDSLSGQIEKAIEDINTANFDLETQRIALETLETNHSAQVSKTEANQATQSQIDALTVETLNNAIENAQVEIRSINAELSAAQALLATPALSAKADGVVTLVSYTEGDTVPAGKSVVTIGDSGEKCVAAEIPQEDIGGVELGQAVELQFVADPDNTTFSDKLTLTDEMTAASGSVTLDSVYEAQVGGATAGYAIKVVASGSQGKIEMMVGVDGEGTVTGVSIVKNAETAGIGSKVMTNMPTASGVGVLSQFEGKSAADGLLAVGTNVDAISGATVSTRGVTNGVNAALAVAGVMG